MEFLELLRGGAGLFRDQLDGGNWGCDWPLALLRDKIQFGLARHGLQIFERADTRSVFRFVRGDGLLERFGWTFQKLNRFHRRFHKFHMMRAIIAKKTMWAL